MAKRNRFVAPTCGARGPTPPQRGGTPAARANRIPRGANNPTSHAQISNFGGRGVSIDVETNEFRRESMLRGMFGSFGGINHRRAELQNHETPQVVGIDPASSGADAIQSVLLANEDEFYRMLRIPSRHLAQSPDNTRALQDMAIYGSGPVTAEEVRVLLQAAGVPFDATGNPLPERSRDDIVRDAIQDVVTNASEIAGVLREREDQTAALSNIVQRIADALIPETRSISLGRIMTQTPEQNAADRVQRATRNFQRLCRQTFGYLGFGPAVGAQYLRADELLLQWDNHFRAYSTEGIDGAALRGSVVGWLDQHMRGNHDTEVSAVFAAYDASHDAAGFGARIRAQLEPAVTGTVTGRMSSPRTSAFASRVLTNYPLQAAVSAMQNLTRAFAEVGLSTAELAQQITRLTQVGGPLDPIVLKAMQVEAAKNDPHPEAGKPIATARMQRSIVGVAVESVRGNKGEIIQKPVDRQQEAYKPKSRLRFRPTTKGNP